jgi:cell division protease FtsH
MDQERNEGTRRRIPPWFFIGLAMAAVLLFLPLLRGSSGDGTEDVPLQTLAQIVEDGDAERIVVKGDKLTLERSDGTEVESRKEDGTSALETLQLLGVSDEALQGVEIEVEGEGTSIGSILLGLVSFAPLLIFLFIVVIIWRQLRNSGGGVFGFGRSKARMTGIGDQRPSVTFADVAGVAEAKLELQEVVEFLKNPEKFLRLGAHVPKGVLLVGPPGTGKTLLARAVAGEAGVAFFSISASEFVEMFVGTGASRVRDLFEKAKATSPSIIFIDEIDAVGRRRGVGLGGGNDEREQTLNQILVEMDGFETGTSVIVIAATNRADVLDAALLRAGRFDRRVTVDRPDLEGREAILRVHSRGKPLAPGVELTDAAKLTVGFTGADLENLMNEAAILAARSGNLAIDSSDLNAAFERIVAGPERSKKLLSPQERRVVAFHEAGHAIVMESMPLTDPVHKISIISRGLALGYTMALPERDKVLRSKEAIEEEIAGLLGGRVAEELLCGSVTTGAANDLERASALARAMVTQYGMSDELGLRTFAAADQAVPGWPPQQRDYAEGTGLRIDAEINGILDRAHARAKAVLAERWSTISRLAGALLDHETLERPEIENLLVDDHAGTEVPCVDEVTARPQSEVVPAA